MYAVYAEQFGIMMLAEDGFASVQAAGEWAAAAHGLGNWWIVQYVAGAQLPETYEDPQAWPAARVL